MQAFKNKLASKTKALKSEFYEILAVILIGAGILLYMRSEVDKSETRKSRRNI